MPYDSRNREQFDWLAHQVVEAGGEATIWVGRITTAEQERKLVARMREAIAAEYLQLVADAGIVQAQEPGQRRRSLGRLRRELRKIRERDFFPTPERELAQQAVEALAVAVEVPAG